MKQELRVSLIGESVLVEGIAICLEEDPYYNVQRIHADNNHILLFITEFNPDVIIYPLRLAGMEEILSQVKLSTGVRFVGLDIDTNQVLIMDGQLYESPSMADLKRLIILRIKDCSTSGVADQDYDRVEKGAMEINT